MSSNGPLSDSQRDRDEEDDRANEEDDEEEELKRRESKEEDDDIHSDDLSSMASLACRKAASKILGSAVLKTENSTTEPRA